jgi:hypothetical protein
LAKRLIILDDRYQSALRHRGFPAASLPTYGAAHRLALLATPNISKGLQQNNAALTKRWLMPSAIGLGKRGCLCRVIVTGLNFYYKG